jgi:hypothetical protein
MDLLDELGRLVGEVSDPNVTTSVPWVGGWVAFCAGRYEESVRQFRIAAAMQQSFAPLGLYQSARAALWGGDAGSAAADLAGIDATGIRAPVIALRTKTIQAGLAASAGRTADAIRLYRGALRGWADFGQAMDEALVGIDMAILVGPSEPEARAAAARAREVLGRMPNSPLLQRLDAAMAHTDRGGSDAQVKPASTRSGEPAGSQLDTMAPGT